MKTRRSWRNQERLWREIGGVNHPKPTKKTKLPTIAEVKALRQQEYQEYLKRPRQTQGGEIIW